VGPVFTFNAAEYQLATGDIAHRELLDAALRQAAGTSEKLRRWLRLDQLSGRAIAQGPSGEGSARRVDT